MTTYSAWVFSEDGMVAKEVRTFNKEEDAQNYVNRMNKINDVSEYHYEVL